MISIYEIHTSMEGVGINMCLGAKKGLLTNEIVRIGALAYLAKLYSLNWYYVSI
jgi:hypothetical protein